MNKDKTEQIRKELLKIRDNYFEIDDDDLMKDIANYVERKLEEQKQSLCEEVEKLRKDYDPEYTGKYSRMNKGFNQALDTVLSIIKK